MRANKALRFFICLSLLTFVVLASVSCSESESAQTFEQILSVIPDTEDNRAWVVINDYAQIRNQFGINAPRTDATAEEQMAYLISLFKGGTEECIHMAAGLGFINSNQFLQYSLGSMGNLGIGYWAIDQEVRAGSYPPTKLSIVKGQFDPETIRQALDVSAKDAPPSIETYNNTIFSWGGDNEANLGKRFSPPAFDSLGRGGRFVFQSDYAFRTTETSVIKLIIDTQNGMHNSLFDVSDFKLIARELSSLGTMSVLLSNQTQSVNYVRNLLATGYRYEAEDIDKVLSQGPKLLPYQTIAFGVAKDEEGLHALIILVHADTKTATSNVHLLLQRIEETSRLSGTQWTKSITNSSIISNGRILVAKLYGSIHFDSFTWYPQGDFLFLHE